MHEDGPSRTALGAAAYRAAHQTVDGAAVFADPLAHTILGADADAIIARCDAADPAQKRVRMFMAARSRFAEDCLAGAVARGVRQAVILGAGLDTFAWRTADAAGGLRLFEVDHPATQAWKRKRLAEAGLATPASLTFVPVDLDRQDLPSALAGAGFRAGEPAFFHWLGVVPYLPRAVVGSTLQFIAGVPRSEVVFDYTEPFESHPEDRRASLSQLGASAAAVGEPWITFLDPGEIAAELRTLGFTELEDLGLADIASRYLGAPAGQAGRGPGPHLLRAARPDRG
jgi:methyltransferase (TIGR00027 family)